MKNSVSDLVYKIEGYGNEGIWEVLSIAKDNDGTYTIHVCQKKENTNATDSSI